MRVDVSEYDPAWPAEFARIQDDLAAALTGVDVVGIEHVGSTSVPGLAAKPILDIDVIVPRPAVQPAIAAMRQAGYEYEGDRGIRDRHAFAAPDDKPPRHVYVCVDGALALRNHIAVRNILREDPALRDEYGELKVRIATKELDDIDSYLALKSPVLQRILERAGIAEDERTAIEETNPS